MNVKVALEPVRDLGDTPLGRRRIIGVTGGSFAGPRLSGRVLPGGEDVDPALYYMRATPWFETSAAQYAWLNRTICIASGARRPTTVELDFYEVK
jgi:hypothetical protein